MQKNKVIGYLNFIGNYDKPIVYYIKGDENIREVFLKCLLNDMTVSFDNLGDYMVKHIKDDAKLFNGATSFEEKLEIFVALKNKSVDKHTENLQIGSCGEGAVNFECFEMTDEEFANPTGEIMSPYAYDYLEEGEEPKRNKYSFMNQMTGKITFIDGTDS